MTERHPHVVRPPVHEPDLDPCTAPRGHTPPDALVFPILSGVELYAVCVCCGQLVHWGAPE